MIKLYKASVTADGTVRLQSQLYLKRLACDFILRDNQLYCWGFEKGDTDFHKTNIEYEIVDSINEMREQKL